MNPSPQTDTFLSRFLAEQDISCPNPACGFNLRGLTHNACPECAHPLALCLQRPEPLMLMRTWIVAAIVSITATSFLSLAFRLFLLWQSGLFSLVDWAMGVGFIHAAVLAAAYSFILGRYLFARHHMAALPNLLRKGMILLFLSYTVTFVMMSFQLLFLF